MRRLALLLLLLPVTAARADDLDTTLRQLEKDIAKVRGLEFKSPVKAKVIPRPKDTPASQQGYYSTREKTLVTYEDVKANYERGVLVHEMVHALQDQHFGLDKLHQQTFGSDSELAMAALIEGDATFTMIELLKKDQPRVAAMLDTPLEKAKNLQSAFLYAQGARYVRALKERGGWKAVNDAYKFSPDSTAEILHPGERISVIDLGPGKTKGELHLVELLQAQPDAATAASGWRGDREIRDGVWVIAFDSDEHALRFQKALAKAKAPGEKDGAKAVTAEPGMAIWQKGGKEAKVWGVLARGHRVFAVEAADEKGFRENLDCLEGPLSVEVYSAKDKKNLGFGEFTDRLLEADIVCIGESHDSDLNHRVQLQVLKALFSRDERVGLGMEMFQKPFQGQIDRYLKGEISEGDFLKAAEYRERWGFEWQMYRPLVEFCRRNGIPLAALNAPRELTRQISKLGIAGLKDDEKKQLGDIDYQVKEHRDYWFDRLAEMHGQKNAPAEQKERGYQVMATWDGFMARTAAEFQKERRVRRMVLLAGSGHIERGFGIPDRAAKLTGGKVATVAVLVEGSEGRKPIDVKADFVVLVKKQ